MLNDEAFQTVDIVKAKRMAAKAYATIQYMLEVPEDLQHC